MFKLCSGYAQRQCHSVLLNALAPFGGKAVGTAVIVSLLFLRRVGGRSF